MFTGWRSKRRLRRHVAIPEHHSLKRRASQDEEAPTDERSGLACQTIWCRYAPGIAGSMAKFSAKRKGRQSFAPQFVYPSKVQNQTNARKTTPNIARLVPPVALGREVLKRGAGAGLRQDRAALFDRLFHSVSLQDHGLLGRDPRRPLHSAEYRQTEGNRYVRKAQSPRRERPSRRPCPRSGEPHCARNQAPK